jgi:hypothetical protein
VRERAQDGQVVPGALERLTHQPGTFPDVHARDAIVVGAVAGSRPGDCRRPTRLRTSRPGVASGPRGFAEDSAVSVVDGSSLDMRESPDAARRAFLACPKRAVYASAGAPPEPAGNVTTGTARRTVSVSFRRRVHAPLRSCDIRSAQSRKLGETRFHAPSGAPGSQPRLREVECLQVGSLGPDQVGRAFLGRPAAMSAAAAGRPPSGRRVTASSDGGRSVPASRLAGRVTSRRKAPVGAKLRDLAPWYGRGAFLFRSHRAPELPSSSARPIPRARRR